MFVEGARAHAHAIHTHTHNARPPRRPPHVSIHTAPSASHAPLCWARRSSASRADSDTRSVKSGSPGTPRRRGIVSAVVTTGAAAGCAVPSGASDVPKLNGDAAAGAADVAGIRKLRGLDVAAPAAAPPPKLNSGAAAGAAAGVVPNANGDAVVVVVAAVGAMENAKGDPVVAAAADVPKLKPTDGCAVLADGPNISGAAVVVVAAVVPKLNGDDAAAAVAPVVNANGAVGAAAAGWPKNDGADGAAAGAVGIKLGNIDGAAAPVVLKGFDGLKMDDAPGCVVAPNANGIAAGAAAAVPNGDAAVAAPPKLNAPAVGAPCVGCVKLKAGVVAAGAPDRMSDGLPAGSSALPNTDVGAAAGAVAAGKPKESGGGAVGAAVGAVKAKGAAAPAAGANRLGCDCAPNTLPPGAAGAVKLKAPPKFMAHSRARKPEPHVTPAGRLGASLITGRSF
jgi:hypothetical protein